jgi:hypothetical protein
VATTVLILDDDDRCSLEGEYLSKAVSGRAEPYVIWLGQVERVDWVDRPETALSLLAKGHYDEVIISSDSAIDADFWDKIRAIRRLERVPVTFI